MAAMPSPAGGIPLPRSASEAARKFPGTKENPLSRATFTEKWLPILRTKQTDASCYFQKSMPTLVLYPPDGDVQGQPMQMDMPKEMQAYMRIKGTDVKTFKESVSKARGKALLMNVCTPFLEVYPKDEADCKKLYDLTTANQNIVPETSEADL